MALLSSIHLDMGITSVTIDPNHLTGYECQDIDVDIDANSAITLSGAGSRRLGRTGLCGEPHLCWDCDCAEKVGR